MMIKRFTSHLVVYAKRSARKFNYLSTGDKIALASLVLAIATALIPLFNSSPTKNENASSLTESNTFIPYSELEIIKKLNQKVYYINVENTKSYASFHKGIKAKIGDQVYTLLRVEDEGMCAKVIDSQDFDGNGSTDALVTNIVGCGGNCCANSFFFYSYDGDGHFSKTEEFGESWSEPEIEKWRGHWSVLVTNVNEAMGEHKFYEIVERYILQSGKAVLVEKTEKREIEAITEIRSDSLNSSKSKSKKKIYYDLDSDGRTDTLCASYWGRWHKVFFSVSFANGKSFYSSTGLSRIGILKSKTNGVHDLVGDFDFVIRWKGDRYDIDDEVE